MRRVSSYGYGGSTVLLPLPLLFLLQSERRAAKAPAIVGRPLQRLKNVRPSFKTKKKRKKKSVFRRRLDQNRDCALLSANAPPKNNSVSSFHAAFVRLPHPEFPRTQPLPLPSAQTTSMKAASMSHKAHVFVCVQADGRK